MCLEKRAQKCIVQLAQYSPAARKYTKKTALIFVPKGCLENRAPFLLYGLYGSIQYGPAKKNQDNTHKKKCLGICALLFLGNVPTKLLTFLSQALSKNLSQSPSLVVSCTLPNAFFYKSENDIFPPKCLFTFPNPKSKGQDLILPFSRSRVMICSLQNESLKILK
jgi:hypothetical protein